MISKALLKRLNSLKHKKYRDAEKLFVAEGERLVTDLIPHFSPLLLVALPSWIESNRQLLTSLTCEIVEATAEELARITLLTTSSPVYALFGRREESGLQGLLASDDIVLALDTVQDPGNLGTIIRTADWFGVRNILCSRETADLYNPKVIQSTMGAIARVNLVYCDLAETLRDFSAAGWSLYGTFLDGTNLYEFSLKKQHSVIVMGNEGQGITPAVSALITDRLLIPSYPAGQPTSESLNVSIATAIILSEFRRP